jgi:hypothetical protein
MLRSVHQIGVPCTGAMMERVLQARNRIAPLCGTNSNSQHSNFWLKLHAHEPLNTGKF